MNALRALSGPTDLSTVDPRPEWVLTEGEREQARAVVLKHCTGDAADVLAALFGDAS